MENREYSGEQREQRAESTAESRKRRRRVRLSIDVLQQIADRSRENVLNRWEGDGPTAGGWHES